MAAYFEATAPLMQSQNSPSVVHGVSEPDKPSDQLCKQLTQSFKDALTYSAKSYMIEQKHLREKNEELNTDLQQAQAEIAELSANDKECRMQMVAMARQIDERDETIEHLRFQL